jgi:hypothetical protein
MNRANPVPAAAPSIAGDTILCTEFHVFMFVGSMLIVTEINLLVDVKHLI